MDEVTKKNIFALRDAIVQLREENDFLKNRMSALENNVAMKDSQLQQFNQRLAVLMAQIGTGPTAR